MALPHWQVVYDGEVVGGGADQVSGYEEAHGHGVGHKERPVRRLGQQDPALRKIYHYVVRASETFDAGRDGLASPTFEAGLSFLSLPSPSSSSLSDKMLRFISLVMNRSPGFSI